MFSTNPVIIGTRNINLDLKIDLDLDVNIDHVLDLDLHHRLHHHLHLHPHIAWPRDDSAPELTKEHGERSRMDPYFTGGIYCTVLYCTTGR